MYCFHRIELQIPNGQISIDEVGEIVVDEVMYIETYRVAYGRGNRAVGLGQSRQVALANAQYALRFGTVPFMNERLAKWNGTEWKLT